MSGPEQREEGLAEPSLTEAGTGSSMSDEQWREHKLDATKMAAWRIGRFIVLGVLGQGGMGSVLRAYDGTLDRQVAVKLMHASKGDVHDKRMLREAQALARLSHPNVVQVYEVGELDGRLFIAMELVRGETLHEWQREHHAWRRCLEVYLQAGRGLAAAHAAGMIHRDFKPANCIIDESGRVRVLDFGLARHAGELHEDVTARGPALAEAEDTPTKILERRLTRDGSVVGTVSYMAPEQLHGKEVDARADQFSFCVSLVQALFQRDPFGAAVPGLATVARSREPLTAPAGSGVPRGLVRVLDRGLAGDPSERWPSMDALLEALERHLRRPPVGKVVLGAMAFGLGVLGLWPSGDQGAERSPCEGAGREATALWDGEVQQRVERALRATEVPYADDAWSRVDSELHGYAQHLEAAYAEACEATKVRFERTGADLERSEACLDQRASALRRATSMLERADAAVVETAVDLVVALPELDACAELGSSDAAAEPDRPVDAMVLEELGRARALEITGKYAQALEAIESLRARAPTLEGPALAEAQAIEGRLRSERGEHERAEALLRDAYRAGLQYRADAVALEALASLIHLLGIEQTKTEIALWLGDSAEALIDRGEADRQVQARAITALGHVFVEHGEPARAQQEYEEALELVREAVGDRHIAMAEPLDGLAVALRHQGQLDDAWRQSQRALEIRTQWLGERHPDVAHQRVNLGAVLYSQKQYEQARELLGDALAVLEDAELPNRVTLAHGRTNYAASLAKLQEWEEAERQARRAVEDWAAVVDPAHSRVAEARITLGWILHRRERFAEAIEQFERALAILAQHDPTPELEAFEASARRGLAKAKEALAGSPR